MKRRLLTFAVDLVAQWVIGVAIAVAYGGFWGVLAVAFLAMYSCFCFWDGITR